MLDLKYDFKKVEDGKYEFWNKNRYFEAGDKSKIPFTIVIPPPNITGNLHIGHAFDCTIQDVIIRYKKLKGFDTLWLPGTDHAAIATEAKVVKKLKDSGIDKYSCGREKFLEECWNWSNEHNDNIKSQWAKMGCALDYTRERFTLDEELNKAVNYVFIDLYNKGLIYRKEKLINWDSEAQTALSNEEVIYEEENAKLYYLKYLIAGTSNYIEVATTRPETIFGDTAVAVNPNDDKYKDLIGKKVVVPLINREVNLIADEIVLLDFGTGALKITPAHSFDDELIGEKHNLESINILNSNGTLNKNTGKYEGMDVITAREKIVEDLKLKNLLTKIEDYVHQVGHSERTGKIVEPFLSKQWFVKMSGMANNLLEEQKTENRINFLPAHFEKILTHWMTNCKDWCISRQLWWGHRIPAWYKNDELVVSAECPGDGWVQDSDVLDTWFSSALWPFSTLGWPNETEDYKRYFPGDVLVTAYDIIFFWVARMAFSSLEQTKKLPFKNCIIHGLIRDKNGIKMSKSLGNGIDPMQIIEQYGADALRFYLGTSCAPGADLRFDETKISSSWNFINKLWNASKFVLMNLENFETKNFDLENLKIEDKWILTKLQKTIQEVTENMDKYLIHNAGNIIYDFTWNVFCDWYIEISKRTINDNITKSVLLYILDSIIKMLHPFIPFVSEEIYLQFPTKGKSIMESEYPTYQKQYIFEEELLIDNVIKDITNIRNIKKENNITKDALVDYSISKEVENIYISLLKLNIRNKEESYTKYNYTSSLINITYYVNNKDSSSLSNKIELEKESLILSIKKRKELLSNQNYIEKAPNKIVEEEKRKLEEEKERLKIIIKD